jgi:hypothetical protein
MSSSDTIRGVACPKKNLASFSVGRADNGNEEQKQSPSEGDDARPVEPRPFQHS